MVNRGITYTKHGLATIHMVLQLRDTDYAVQNVQQDVGEKESKSERTMGEQDRADSHWRRMTEQSHPIPDPNDIVRPSLLLRRDSRPEQH